MLITYGVQRSNLHVHSADREETRSTLVSARILLGTLVALDKSAQKTLQGKRSWDPGFQAPA